MPPIKSQLDKKKSIAEKNKDKNERSIHDIVFSDDEKEIELENVSTLHDEAVFCYNESNSDDTKKFREFLSNPEFINPLNDPSTNIIDRSAFITKSKNASCFKIPDTKIDQFFKYMEVCRRCGTKLMLYEKQLEYSGIMIDFDISQTHPESSINKKMYSKICNVIIKYLSTFLNITEPIDGHGQSIPVYMAFTRKPKVLYNEEKSCHRDGLHILIPSVKITRETKRLLISKMKEDKAFDDVFKEITPASKISRNDFVDINSAHVPVAFLGNSSKIGAEPYRLDEIFEIDISSDDHITTSCIERFNHIENPQVILVEELSLNWMRPANKNPIITKMRYLVKEEYQNELLKYKTNSAKDEEIIDDNNVYGTDDPSAPLIKKLLDTLSPHRAREYHDWRKVLCVLANASRSFKGLAEYFSKKCAEKYSQNGFDKEWNTIISAKKEGGLTIGSLHYWARIDNPERYQEILKSDTFNIINKRVYSSDCHGALQHYDIAKILHHIYKFKYVYDPLCGKWFEFITQTDSRRDGELFKWREYPGIPSSIKMNMSESVSSLFNAVLNKMNESIENSNEDMANWHTKVKKEFSIVCKKMRDSGFKTSVSKECEQLFENLGFSAGLDNNATIFGVGNGILKLGKSVEFIQGYHNYMVSKYTTVDYAEFDPTNPITKKLLYALRNLFPDDEPDSFDFMMHYLASSLDGRKKESIFLIFIGTGSNGKSFLMELHKGMIGTTYGKKIPLTLITAKEKVSDAATPILMSLKGSRFAYFSESDKTEKANCKKIKELTGLETIAGRDLFSGMSNFRNTSNLILITNYLLEFDSNDDAIWRRIIIVPAKMKFCATNVLGFERSAEKNPYEREADLNLALDWNERPEVQSAYLSIMCHYYESLMRNYGGEVRAVPHPNIKHETMLYRNKQDYINNFIDMRIVKTANGEEDMITMESLIDKYSAWYRTNNPDDRILGKGIKDAFENSKLANAFVPTRSGKVIYGHRILDTNELPNDAIGETYFTEINQATQIKKTYENNDQYYQRMCHEAEIHKKFRQNLIDESEEEKSFRNLDIVRSIMAEDINVNNVKKTESYLYDKNGMREIAPKIVQKIAPKKDVTFNDDELSAMLSASECEESDTEEKSPGE